MRYQSYPKRDPIRNYFPVPNEVFVLGLSPGELAVYCYLLFCEDRTTYQCWPSFQTIGKAWRSGDVLSGAGHGNPQRRADSSALVRPERRAPHHLREQAGGLEWGRGAGDPQAEDRKFYKNNPKHRKPIFL